MNPAALQHLEQNKLGFSRSWSVPRWEQCRQGSAKFVLCRQRAPGRKTTAFAHCLCPSLLEEARHILEYKYMNI